jgi:hypothetical protein
MRFRPGRPSSLLANRVRSILAARGLTFADVYRASRIPDGDSSVYRIPHNFHRALLNPQFFPSLYQILTLSKLTGYRLADWLAVFGFSFDEVGRFQVLFPAARTVELDARIYDTNHTVPWFRELRPPDFVAQLIPLRRWLGLSAPRTLHPVRTGADSSHRYVKIGAEDALAFPDLLPGSIVRIRQRHGTNDSSRATGLFLVEHSQGLACTRVGRSSSGKFVLCSRHLPYAPVELQPGTEAILRGRADLELRLLGGTKTPVVPSRLGRFWTPSSLADTSEMRVGGFVRRARMRSGLAFREASERTKQISRMLGDARYYCAPGTLSDFETRKLLPRQIHKIISICAVYFASPAGLMNVAGVPFETAGHLRMPPEFLPKAASENTLSERSPFFRTVEKRFGRVPFFLSRSLAHLLRLPDFSPRDVFWAGSLRAPKRSGFAGALFLAVDRRQKVPRPSLSAPASQQPLYVLLQRDGTYLCGFCTLQNGVLILSPCVAGRPKLLRLRNHVEAEVIGRVVAILRKLR